MKKNIFKITFLILLIFSVSLFLTACGNNSEEADESMPEEINFGILRVPNDQTIAMVEGYFDDYFTDQGIETNFTVFDSGSEANQALASGSIDFATMGNVNAVTSLTRELDVEMIWIHEVLGEIEALAVKEDSDINSIEDLAGERVAVPFASTCHYVLLNALKDAGIEDEVRLLDMKTTEIVAAWERDDIKAAYLWQPTLGEVLKTGRVLVNSEEMAEKGYITANVEVVRTEFAEKYPELVVSFITMLSEAGDIYREDPERAAEIVSETLEITPEEALMQMEGSRWLTREEEISEEFLGTRGEPGHFAEVMKNTSDFLLEQDSVDNSPSQEEFNDYVNPEYIEMSLE
ncbi:MAG: glycine betaine ABC transporter substrate-binding protein [Halanaerobiales bacterium]